MRIYGRNLLHPAIFHAARTIGCSATTLPSYTLLKPQLARKTEVTKGADHDIYPDICRLQAATGIPVQQDADSLSFRQNRLQNIIESSSPHVAVAALALNHPEVDKMGLVSVSPSFEELFGYSKQELLGKNAARLLCNGHVDPVLELYLEVASSASHLRSRNALSVTLRRKTGELVDGLMLVTKLKAVPDVLLVHVVDRLEQPDAEEQLLAQALRLGVTSSLQTLKAKNFGSRVPAEC